MNKLICRLFAATLLFGVIQNSTAGSITYDTITSYRMGAQYTGSHTSITGIEKNTGNLVTTKIEGSPTLSTVDKFVQKCSAAIITAMDKPGRYYLHYAWEDHGDNEPYYCILEVKNPPE